MIKLAMLKQRNTPEIRRACHSKYRITEKNYLGIRVENMTWKVSLSILRLLSDKGNTQRLAGDDTN